MDSAVTGTVCSNVVIVCPPLGCMGSAARAKDDLRNHNKHCSNHALGGAQGGSVWHNHGGSSEISGGGVGKGEQYTTQGAGDHHTVNTESGHAAADAAAGGGGGGATTAATGIAGGGNHVSRDSLQGGSNELLIHAWMEEVLDLLDRVPSVYVVVMCPLSYQAEIMPYTCMRSCRILVRPVKLHELLSVVFSENLLVGGNMSQCGGSGSPLAQVGGQMYVPSPFGSVSSDKRGGMGLNWGAQKQVWMCVCMCVGACVSARMLYI
jgi:hypothetical protein